MTLPRLEYEHIQNKDFIDLTLKVKNELQNTFDTMISGKTSRYNSEVFVYKCQICDKNTIKGDVLPLETHHINFQKDFNKVLYAYLDDKLERYKKIAKIDSYLKLAV